MKPGFVLLIIGLTFLSGCRNSLSEKDILAYKEKGRDISQATYLNLSGTLKEKMMEGGIPLALEYCNSNALSLTEEMSELHGVTIRRTALKLRNRNNSPSPEEEKILNDYKAMSENGQALDPVVLLDTNGDPHYYAPILLEKKCLPCHGTLGKEVSVVVDSMIKTYYPDDKALGFKENELRGLWSISFRDSN
jgi:hypothetical protein